MIRDASITSLGPTQADAAVLQQVAEVVEHSLLVLTADPTEVAEEATAAGHHLREGYFLRRVEERPQSGFTCVCSLRLSGRFNAALKDRMADGPPVKLFGC